MEAEAQFQPGERITHHEFGQGVVLDPARDGYLRAFFGVDGPAPACKIGWVRVPGGGILEIFAFEPKLPPETKIPWNRTGLTHFSFNVRDTQKWYDYLVSKGVECVTKPERSPRGHTFFFARDFDGNSIEMIDLGYILPAPGYTDERIHLFLARGLSPATQNLDTDEVITDVRAVPVAEVRRQIEIGRAHV